MSLRQPAEASALNRVMLRDAILDSVPSQIAVLDYAGTIVAVNRVWRRFGQDNRAAADPQADDRHIGVNYLAICDAAIAGSSQGDARLVRDGILSVITRSAQRFQMDYSCHSPDQLRWFSLEVTPLHVQNHAVVVTHSDITQRRVLEQLALQISENKFRWVADNTADVILIIDASMLAQYVSPSYEKMFGYPDAEVRNRSPEGFFAIIHPEDRDTIRRVFDDALAAKETDLRQSFRIMHKQGHYLWIEDSVKFQYDASGHFVQACIATRDITQRKHAESTIAQMNHELSESRQELRKLMAANETRIEDEKRHIALEIHDELGQVLTALRMDLSLAMIRYGDAMPELKAELQGMKSQIGRSIQSVRDVATSLRPAVLDMGLVPSIAWLCRESSRRGIFLCEFKSPDEAMAPQRNRDVVIFRIIQESLTNISRYACASHVAISLLLQGSELLLEINDNGIGFDLEAAAQRDSLGLLGMRERAIALGGQLEVDSILGKGTTIRVRVPVVPDLNREPA
jgi:PAS domain S-box-containing protein